MPDDVWCRETTSTGSSSGQPQRGQADRVSRGAASSQEGNAVMRPSLVRI
jgi:hypothetical protein